MRNRDSNDHHAPFLLALFLLMSGTSLLFADARSECNNLTGNIHTRVAWREGGDQISGGSNAIKGFDSKTGQVHTVWSGGCIKSVLVAGGHKVAVTSGDYNVWVVDWDGSNKTHLASGSVSDGWRDPATGKDWIIYRGQGHGTGGGVWRVLIEDKSQKVKLTDRQEGHAVYPWFQISADGKRAASFFPWSNGGVLNLETGHYSQITNGCWSGMASDNSYFWFHLAGSHKDLVTFRDAQKLGTVNAMPPIQPAGQIYCPRAAEGPQHGGRFLVLSGGYPGYNQNGTTVEIFMGRWSSGYDRIEAWARITNNGVADQHPTAWVGVESGQASISLSSTQLAFSAQEGGSQPSSKTVQVTSPSGTLENPRASSNRSWLGVELTQSGSGHVVENTVDISGLDAGVHTATVTVSADNATPSSKSYSVTLTIEGGSVATTVEVTPSSKTLKPGETATFSAQLLDQFGDPLDPQPSVSWSAGNGADIDGNGTFTAPQENGTYTVTAEAEGLSGTASVTVKADVQIDITSSHAGETYHIGQTVTIAWSATQDIGINLWASVDNGKQWLHLNPDKGRDTENGTGSFDWTIPREIEGVSLEADAVLLRVSDYWNENVDSRSGTFAITASASILDVPLAEAGKNLRIHRGRDGLQVTVPYRRRHSVRLVTPAGAVVATRTASRGPARYVLPLAAAQGLYLLEVRSTQVQLRLPVVVAE